MKGGVINHEKTKEILSKEKTLLEPVGFQKILFRWDFECWFSYNHHLFIGDCSICKFKGSKNCVYYET